MLDFGYDGNTLMHNIRALGLGVDNLEKAVLSHGHIDHTGRLAAFLSARNKKALTIIAHPDVLEFKEANIKGSQVPIGLPKLPTGLSEKMKLELNRSSVKVLPKLYTTWEIPIEERQEKPGFSSRILHRVKVQCKWDPVIDDLSLVLHTKKGAVITGCCHAGLLNTCAKVTKLFNRKIEAIIGGTHMVEYPEQEVEHVVESLKNDYGTPMLYLNHCTGNKAIEQMKKMLGPDIIHDYPAGMELDFEI